MFLHYLRYSSLKYLLCTKIITRFLENSIFKINTFTINLLKHGEILYNINNYILLEDIVLIKKTNLKGVTNMWVIYALLSAVFAALTSILAKIGIENINSNLATAIRTVVVLVMAWGIVLINGSINQIGNITQKSWIFLILSGIATGLSWLFYYKALQMGDASKVVPIDKFSVVITMVLAFVILKEAVTIKTVVGGIFITIGTFILIL